MFRSPTSDKEMKSREESERREEYRREKKKRKGKSQKKEDTGARIARKVRNTAMVCGSGRSKTRLAKAAGLEPFRQERELKNCTPLRHKAHVEVKMHKHLILRTVLEDKCRKSARSGGAKHIPRSKSTKHTSLKKFPRLGMPKNGHAFPMQGTISVPGGMQYETKTDFRPSLRNCTHNRPAYNYFISSVLWYVEI